MDDNGYVSNYWYDAGGNRTVKTSGESEQVYVLGAFSGGRTNTADFTLYVNPYMVVGKGGRYTKHIYIGSERIVSKLGDLGSFGADPRRVAYAGANTDVATPDYKAMYNAEQAQIKARYDTLDVPYNGTNNDDYVNGAGFCCNADGSTGSAGAAIPPSGGGGAAGGGGGNITGGNDNPEKYQYYYHSDHLGSTSYITNLDGEVSQHVEYMPFGEVFLEERDTTWNTPYKFNGKELDEETGLYYYGARYYDPRSSLWLSTDPLAEKYPGVSPYCYTLNNPIIFIDIDGKRIRFTNEATYPGSYTDRFAQVLSRDFGVKNLFRISADGYLEIRKDISKAEQAKLSNNKLYQTIRAMVNDTKNEVVITADAQDDGQPVVYRYDEYFDKNDGATRIDVFVAEQLSADNKNIYKGSNLILHYLSEQWSRQVDNKQNVNDYSRDHAVANKSELDNAGMTFGKTYYHHDDGSDNWISEIVNKSGNVVGYSQIYYIPGQKGATARDLSVEQGQTIINKIGKTNGWTSISDNR